MPTLLSLTLLVLVKCLWALAYCVPQSVVDFPFFSNWLIPSDCSRPTSGSCAGRLHVTKFYSFPYSNIKIPTISRQKMKTKENSIQFSWLWHPSRTSCGETQCYQTQIWVPTAMLPRSSHSALPAAAEAQVGRPELMLTHHLFMYLKRS